MRTLQVSTTTILISLMVLVISCSSSEASKKKSEVPSQAFEQDKKWVEGFKKASRACKSFKEFLKSEFPTNEIKLVAELRYTQKCDTKQFTLKNHKSEWLKNDAILTGLRGASTPALFSQYYEAFLNLDIRSRSTLEYLERTTLFKKNIRKVNQKTQADVFDKMLNMFPAFYVDYKRAVPENKRFEAAYGLRMQRKFAQSRRLYNQIIASSKKKLDQAKSTRAKKNELETLFKAYEYTRTTYRVEENKLKGIEEYKKAVDFFEKYLLKNPKKDFAKYYTDTAVQLARDIWTEGKVTQARQLLQDVIKKAPKAASLDQVYWVLGRMDQEKKDYASAIEFFEKALKEDPDKEFRLKLLWLVAWNAKKNGQVEKAIDDLETLESKSKGSQYESYYYKSLFWQAMLYRELKKEDKAKKILEKISEDNFFGYYGRLATLEINPTVFEKQLVSEYQPESGDAVDINNERTIRILLEMDESQILSEYLSHLWRNIGKSSRKKMSTRLKFLFWASETGLLKENQQFIEIFDMDSKIELFEKAPSFFYPQPYLNTVSSFGNKFKVPRELVYSIMRQESLFDRKARSPADAFGLLQLLPRVASKHMEETGVQFSRPDELYDPQVILPLGIAHLRQLLNLFNGSMFLTAASYNAGVNPVRGWLKSRYNNNSYEFIEDIPYLETEHYVKLVFRNLSFYVQFNKDVTGNSRIDLLKSYFEVKSSAQSKPN